MTSLFYQITLETIPNVNGKKRVKNSTELHHFALLLNDKFVDYNGIIMFHIKTQETPFDMNITL